MSDLFRIKPLTWKLSETTDTVATADTPFGAYWARPSVVLSLGSNRYTIRCGGPSMLIQDCESLEAGKAACEAHYRERIAAALEPVEADYLRESEELLCGHCGHPIRQFNICSRDCEYSNSGKVRTSRKVRRYRETVVMELLSEEAR